MPVRARSWRFLSRIEAAQSRFEIAFGVDQEIGRHDDMIALRHALLDFHAAIATPPELDCARFEPTLAFVDQHWSAP
jgi:hypothetical protein